jgi:hypothetical protein
MTVQSAAAALLIILPLAFNLFFFLLGRRFDYPNILRSPTGEVLSRFTAGGVGLKLLWYGFMLTAVLLAPLAVLLGQVLGRDGLAIVPTATVVGVLAAVVQFFGLARWPFLVPILARKYADPAASEATREATVVVFESFHTYLGVAIGECLGYLFTGAWTVLVAIAMLQSSAFPAWLAWPGIATHARLARVRRPVRGERLETCGHNYPDCLHRLVALAGDLRDRASHRIARSHTPIRECA